MVLPLLPLPPPKCHIVIVGFLPDNNGRSCALHPFGCGNIVVLQCNDGGVGNAFAHPYACVRCIGLFHGWHVKKVGDKWGVWTIPKMVGKHIGQIAILS